MRKRIVLTVVVLFLSMTASPALGQAVLFEEDFNAGIPGTWTTIQLGYTGDNWEPGFGFVNGTGDVYHEGFCDDGSHFRNNILLSPPIDLSSATEVLLEFDQSHAGAAGINYNAIEVSLDGGVHFELLFELISPPNGFSQVSVDMSAFAGQRSVQLALHYKGFISNDWSVDNILVTTPWESLRNSLGGGGFEPLLVGTGPLTPLSSVTLSLTDAPLGVTTYFVVGFAQLNAPFKGGIFVPDPILILGFTTDAGDGSLVVASPWPPGFPSGITIYFQHWIPDAAGPLGYLASNGLSGTTP